MTIALLDTDFLYSKRIENRQRKIRKILDLFEALTRSLSGKNYPPASSLLVLINYLSVIYNEFLQDKEYDNFDPNIKETVQFTLTKLNIADRFEALEQSLTCCLCTLLNPLFKNLPFTFKNTSDAIYDKLKEIMVSRIK